MVSLSQILVFLQYPSITERASDRHAMVRDLIESAQREQQMRRTRLVRQRIASGHSQESLAALLGVDRSTVGRWERGLTTPQPWVRPGLAEALSLPMNELVDLLTDEITIDEFGQPGVEPSTPEWSQSNLAACIDFGEDGWPHDAMKVLRRLLDVYDLPDDGPVRALEDLQRAVAAVVWWRLNSEYARVAEVLPVLVPELTRGVLQSIGQRREALAALLMQVYRAADAIADKFGFHDLSARTIQVMMWVAEQGADPVTLAAVSYVRAETFFSTGQLESGRQMLERAAGQVPAGASPSTNAAYGALHMRAAVTAARAGAAERARDHLGEARAAARGVPDGVYAGTAFGAGSVRIHEITSALELGDVGTALGAAAGWVPPDSLPAERRSHFYVDIARAQLLADRRDAAWEALTTAVSIAPEHIGVQSQVRAMLEKAPERLRAELTR